ncbi:MAG TPA: [protein-PII] uridylyltransferase [Spongiibacteraceae bacterium]|nr:[protein-PII] uridylyltransferase [Spongiibacteraceae bacterium]
MTSALLSRLLPADIFDPTVFASSLATNNSLRQCKAAIERVSIHLDTLFERGENIRDLVHARALFIDELLRCMWQRQSWGNDEPSLIAVGGYGRGELHPYSDIDLLILLPEDSDSCFANAEGFVTFLWDIGLHIGHSVRTVAQCREAAAADITVATNLMESRLLAGSPALHTEMIAATGPDQIWPSRDFFRAKWDEQIERHRKFGNTEYNLEPNVKSSPGGLRDIQMIGWVTKRHFGTPLEELVERSFLTAEELRTLQEGRDFLWQVRYALHMFAKREEDRLLFDHQRALAKLFGYEDTDSRLGVERFMQVYYRWVFALSELNEVLMQHFDEAILRATEPENILEINTRFRVRNGYLEVTNEKVFERTPSALLEVFVLMAQHQHIDGIRAATIRLIRDHAHYINDDFREDRVNTRLFLELLRSRYRVAQQLRRMNRYGVLGRYLPEFGNIIGRMQHDLFHIYTVDAHTLEVVKNMRRFQYDDALQKFPVVSRIVARLPKIELLYIAGLYHDIAKGRGGDHSTLGAQDVQAFCERHEINKRDTNLVAWLVEKHLLMSSVAQRQDISDPEVVRNFALEVADQIRLDYLLALTVADISATNPTLWNAWRASLLRQLYAETKRALRRGLETPVDKHEWIEEAQQAATSQLEYLGFGEDELRELWANVGEDYFLREKVEDIVWHTQAIAQHRNREEPVVLIKESSEKLFEVATQIFVHSRNRPHLFAMLAAAMEQLDLSIQDARLYKSDAGFIFYTFFVLDASGKPIADDITRLDHIKSFLREQLGKADLTPEIMRKRTPRQLRLFSMPTTTMLTTDLSKHMSVLEVMTPDRPGLLARLGRIFYRFGIQLQNAKITTLGERVEDVFFITDNQQRPIEDPELCAAIQDAIKKELDERATA